MQRLFVTNSHLVVQKTVSETPAVFTTFRQELINGEFDSEMTLSEKNETEVFRAEAERAYKTHDSKGHLWQNYFFSFFP